MQSTSLRRKDGAANKYRRAVHRYAETLLFLIAFIAFFALFAIPMGLSNMINTLMNTAYDLLMNTTLYIMAIAVIAGAISSLFTEFGVIRLLNRLLSPMMKPLYNLPGAAALCILTTYFSDNPAILTLAADEQYRRYFQDDQIPVLTNLGTCFGMGMIVSAFMLGLGPINGESTVPAVICGNLGALAGSIFAVRIMLRYTKKHPEVETVSVDVKDTKPTRETSSSGGLRVINGLIRGGKKGVTLGLGIIPGVLIICTLVMMLTNQMPESGYSGGAGEGIGLLPLLAEKASFILDPLFGFSDSTDIAVPITALGSAGAAVGIVPSLIEKGLICGNDIAVFTAMCMGWSGFLSTQVSVMDLLGCSRFTGRALLTQTCSSLIAGTAAHLLYTLI